MDALLAFIPLLNYWAIALCISLALNVWQAVYHSGVASGLKATLAHVFEHGHPAPGTVIVPAANVTATQPADPMSGGGGGGSNVAGRTYSVAIGTPHSKLPWER